MSTALVTGSAGLIGSEASRHFHDLGWDVIVVDNDMRSRFFGEEASTTWMADRLVRDLPRYRHLSIDIRDADAVIVTSYCPDAVAERKPSSSPTARNVAAQRPWWGLA